MSIFDRITCIDPGKVSGWAQYTGKKLTACGIFSDWKYPQIWHSGHEQTFVMEVPRIYPHRSKGDPNDIVDLALTAGEIRGHFRAAGCHIIEAFPRTWKGQVPKEIHHARVLKLLDESELRLLEIEARKFSKTNQNGFDHNMLDAVALGLWFLQRA